MNRRREFPVISFVRDSGGRRWIGRPRRTVSAKMRSFLCAPWKRVRTFEGFVGIFQDAHFRKPVRIFERSAHLRSRAAALHSVPFSRKVVWAPASASIAL